ncbi:MAG TPA: response regulator [Pseudolabrys sp.]|nr:response regulator [Pseudolabrys sp.]
MIEDEILIRMTVAEHLRGCGYKVIEAADADEALLVLQSPDVQIDIVFSDIEMPGAMDGFALSTWLRRNRPEIIIILTGTVPRAADSVAALCDDGPIPKPYEPQHVADRIRRLIGAREAHRK